MGYSVEVYLSGSTAPQQAGSTGSDDLINKKAKSQKPAKRNDEITANYWQRRLKQQQQKSRKTSEERRKYIKVMKTGKGQVKGCYPKEKGMEEDRN